MGQGARAGKLSCEAAKQTIAGSSGWLRQSRSGYADHIHLQGVRSRRCISTIRPRCAFADSTSLGIAIRSSHALTHRSSRRLQYTPAVAYVGAVLSCRTHASIVSGFDAFAPLRDIVNVIWRMRHQAMTLQRAARCIVMRIRMWRRAARRMLMRIVNMPSLFEQPIVYSAPQIKNATGQIMYGNEILDVD